MPSAINTSTRIEDFTTIPRVAQLTLTAPASAAAVLPAVNTQARVDDLTHTTRVPLLALAARWQTGSCNTAAVPPAVHAVARVDRVRTARNRGPQQRLGRQP